MGLLRDLLPPVVSPKMLSWVLHYGFWAMGQLRVEGVELASEYLAVVWLVAGALV